MQRVKFLAVAAVLVLVAGAFFSSQAQKKMAIHKIPTPPMPYIGPLSGSFVSIVEATEISGPQQDPSGHSAYGWTWNGPAKGDLSGFVFLSINYSYTPFEIDPIVTVDPSATPTGNNIIGGSWSKLIFVDGVYQGTVSGRILGGTLSWDEKNSTTAVELKLASDSATDAFAGSVGTGAFSGTMDRNGKFPVLSGTLTLNY